MGEHSPMMRMLGCPPFQIYTNRHLDIWLVGAGYNFAEEFEYGPVSLNWGQPDGEVTKTFKRLTPDFLSALRASHTERTDATERFKEVLGEYWDG